MHFTTNGIVPLFCTSIAVSLPLAPGYECLCCLGCMQPRNHNFATTCVCRVPKQLREEKVIECVHCGCTGCARGTEWTSILASVTKKISLDYFVCVFSVQLSETELSHLLQGHPSTQILIPMDNRHFTVPTCLQSSFLHLTNHDSITPFSILDKSNPHTTHKLISPTKSPPCLPKFSNPKQFHPIGATSSPLFSQSSEQPKSVLSCRFRNITLADPPYRGHRKLAHIAVVVLRMPVHVEACSRHCRGWLRRRKGSVNVQNIARMTLPPFSTLSRKQGRRLFRSILQMKSHTFTTSQRVQVLKMEWKSWLTRQMDITFKKNIDLYSRKSGGSSAMAEELAGSVHSLCWGSGTCQRVAATAEHNLHC
ncbi:hypothetical protein VNO78_15861 [Psophocarpus tetragonolobus]|uniref:Uncharacterized protein n=1 Tax=Psophocarpus tetragonolobus TaxID=3891 RepID=A0AAN9XJZ4_PSOTE